MKIGAKLVLRINAFNIIGINLLAGIILTIAQREINRMANEHAIDLAVQSGEKISKWFEKYLDAARTLAQVMEGFPEIPAAERRWYFDLMLNHALIAHPEVSSVWTNWSPNGLDGMDAEYANTPGTDETGRYVSNCLTGETDFVITIAIPVRNKSAIVGYAGIDLKVPAIQTIAEQVKPFGDGLPLCSAPVGLSSPTPTQAG